MTVIPPGTDTAHFRPDWSRKGDNVIIHVGRIKRYKSTDHLLEAARMLVDKGKRLTVKIVGDGDDVPRLKEITTKLGLEQVVEFTGFIPESDKLALYQQAAVLVENSIKEGWGLIVMEANACGTPVVAARSPGLVDSVSEGESGFLYEYGNVREMADRIELLLDKPDLRAEMGRKGIEWAEKYSWERATDAMLDMINRTIAARHPIPVVKGQLKLAPSER
jgi:glycosyltransferase involved in cell wall biosynthesis